MMDLKYEYTSVEDGGTQYDDYDLKSQNIVPACYIKAKLEIDEGNPFIEALPFPREEKEVLTAYSKSIPSYNFEKTKGMSKLDKMLQTGMLRELRFPLPFHQDLEFNFYNALLVSYRARRQIVSDNQNIQYVVQDETKQSKGRLSGESSDATNAGFSLIGFSGCGKSSAISTLVSHYPQVIMHKDGDGGYFPQITYLVVNCIPNSNFSALYEGIGDAIDKAFGNITPVYAHEVAKTSGLGKKAEKIKNYIELFSIGMIIFDEIQLIDFEHTKENSFDSLLTLANRTKVAIAVVGTEDARDKMFKELRTARRVGTLVNGNLYCGNKKFFDVMVKNLFKYQWFETRVEATEEISDALYEVSKGIIDQLIGVYSCMNIDSIKSNSKTKIDGEYVRKIARKYYPGIQNVLANLENEENERQLMEIREKAEFEISKLLDEERQKQEAEKIMSASTEIAYSEINLYNVVQNIKTLYDEYSDSQIEDAFKKVMIKKSSKGKTEREISRLVIEQLQKTPKRKTTKNKLSTMSVSEMQSFLNLGLRDEGTDI